jgi:hypothetical protein
MLKLHRTRAQVYASSMDSVSQQTIHMTALAVETSYKIPQQVLKVSVTWTITFMWQKGLSFHSTSLPLFKIFSWIMLRS